MNIPGRGSRGLPEGAPGEAAADVSPAGRWAPLGCSGSPGTCWPVSARGSEASSRAAGHKARAAEQTDSPPACPRDTRPRGALAVRSALRSGFPSAAAAAPLQPAPIVPRGGGAPGARPRAAPLTAGVREGGRAGSPRPAGPGRRRKAESPGTRSRTGSLPAAHSLTSMGA